MSLWSTIGKVVGKAAPIVGGLITGNPLPVVKSILGSVLGVDGEDPQQVADAIKDPAALERLKMYEMKNTAELQALTIQAETNRLAIVNKTMQTEIASHDPYVRRWRPTFGYCVSIAWIFQIVGSIACLVYGVIFEPERAVQIISVVAQFNAASVSLWAIALSVLGINITKRSQDKAVKEGKAPPGIIAGLAQMIRGKQGG
tara:strand:+ start:13329 stop:13931 length:603 start_codon:yes stop_codon:yes gene_type:complete